MANAGRVRPVHRGVWNATTAYSVLEIVTNADASAAYMAVADVPVGTTLDTDAYWKLIVKAVKPAKGVDYYTEADQEAIVQQVIAALGTPVFGTVDEDNNIILSGDLADGSYTFKYENSKGDTTVIGVLNTASYTNQIPISTDTDGSIFNGTGYKASARCSSDGSISDITSGTNPAFVTGFIPCKQGDIIRLKNCYIHAHGTNAAYEAIYGNGAYGLRSGLYNSSKAKIAVFSWGNLSQGNDQEYISYVQNGNDYKLTEFSIAYANTAYIRLTLATDGDPANAIVTVNEEIT